MSANMFSRRALLLSQRRRRFSVDLQRVRSEGLMVSSGRSQPLRIQQDTSIEIISSSSYRYISEYSTEVSHNNTPHDL